MAVQLDLPALERMLAAGRDSALLRLSLGSAMLKAERVDEAITHLEKAVELDPKYSAAWRLLGLAHLEQGNEAVAAGRFGTALEVATANGDMQLVKELQVRLRRLSRRD